MKELFQQPFVQVALPILFGIFIASWLQNKRFDDISKRLDKIDETLKEIGKELVKHDRQIVALEASKWK